ncbi:MAG: hypothetical protein ACRD01_08320 [Terriglobales bacterium]
MQALCWYGESDVRVESVAAPTLLLRSDAVIRVTRTAICGSDLHLYDGFIPTMRPGDIVSGRKMRIGC